MEGADAEDVICAAGASCPFDEVDTAGPSAFKDDPSPRSRSPCDPVGDAARFLSSSDEPYPLSAAICAGIDVLRLTGMLIPVEGGTCCIGGGDTGGEPRPI